MCGILGVLNLSTDEPVDQVLLARANGLLAHRGPDDAGVFTDGTVGLAMRRLNIIDVARGRQPMSNEDGTVRLVYNGEIYNHEALRAELEQRGHRFRTACDTEVVLHAYEEWGTERALGRFRGMFAFALWDGRERTLLVARDRMGIKPVYHAEWGGRLYVSSEIRPLLMLSEMDRRVDTEVLEEYLEAGLVTSPRTLFRGVRKLSPAHYLRAGARGIAIRRYWGLSYTTAAGLDRREETERFRTKLEECVRVSLMSEVPLGALLSGGIDSATTVALMQRLTPRRVTTVTVGFSVSSYDESALAAATAKALGTDHHAVTFTKDTMEDLPRALAFREEPVDNPTYVAMYKLFETCRRAGLTVVLTGEGSDELLGGYPWHRHDALVTPLVYLPLPLRRAVARLFRLRYRGDAPLRFSRLLERGRSPVAQRYVDLVGADPLGGRRMLLARGVREEADRAEDPGLAGSWGALLDGMEDAADLHQMLWLESRTRLVDRINHNVDRMSMAHSVEARPPFLDHELWEYCATLPASWKLHGPYPLRTEKYILREATRGLLPEMVRTRKKKGLSVPFTGWLARPRLPGWAEDALAPRSVTEAGMFDPEAVGRLRREVQAGVPGTTDLLMAVFTAQLWWRMFIVSPDGAEGLQ